MPINYRPTSFTGGTTGGGGDVASNGPVGAGLSAGAETSISASLDHGASHIDLSQAHQFFNPQQMSSMAAKAMAAEVAFHPPVSGVEAAPAMSAMPAGLEAHALAAPPPMDATPLAALAGANEPISPLIQMIMRMPGATGLMSSFFEALSQFFFGQLNLPAFLDPALFAQHAAGALKPTFIPGAEHMPVNMSLLPHNAPIFQSLHFGMPGSLPFDQLGTKLGSTIGGQTSLSVSPEHFSGLNDHLKVSAGVDLNKPQFEWSSRFGGQGTAASQGELISGPHLADGKLTSHLGGTQRLFSDRIGTSGLASGRMPLTAGNAGQQGVTSSLSQSVPISNNVSNSLNASGNAFSTSNASTSAAGSFKDTGFARPSVGNDAGYRLTQKGEGSFDLNTTSSTSGDITADKMLAANNTENFRPTLGGMEKQAFKTQPAGQPASSFDSQWTQPKTVMPAQDALAKQASSNLGGMKARQLTFDSLKDPVARAKPAPASTSHKPVMDHQGHQAKANGHYNTGHGHDQISHRHLPRVQYQKPHVKAPVRETPVNAPAPVDGAPSGTQHFQPAENARFQQADSTQYQPQAQMEGQSAGADQVAMTDAAAQAPASYTIKPGDNLWDIARNQMGDATRWKEIYSLNKDVIGTNPDLIHPGNTLELPGMQGDMAQVSPYVVKPGDSLWKISQDLLGDGTRWGELYQANAQIIGGDPRLIMPGQELTIPGMDGGMQTVAQNGAQQAGQQAAQGAQQGAQMPAQTDAVQQADMTQQPDTAQQQTMETQAQAQPVEAPPEAMPEQAMPAQTVPAKGLPGAAQGATPISQVPNYTPHAPAEPGQGAQVASSSLLPTDVLSFLRKKQ